MAEVPTALPGYHCDVLLTQGIHPGSPGICPTLSVPSRTAPQGLECDSGTPYSTETELILYTVRVAARVENALHFLVAYAKGTHPSLAIPLRAVDVTPHTLEILQNNLDALQETLRGDVRNMLESWIAQCIRKYKVIAADPKSTKVWTPPPPPLVLVNEGSPAHTAPRAPLMGNTW